MRNLDSVAELGVYLGLADASGLSGWVRSATDARRLAESISLAAAPLYEQFPRELADETLALLAQTDFKALAVTGGDRQERLSSDLYRRLDERSQRRHGLPPQETFDRHFRHYLCRFAATARAALYVSGIRKEAVDPGSRSARECLEELRRLPCRGFSAQKPGETRQDRVSAGMTQYVQDLLDRHADGCIAPACKASLLRVLDRISAYPEYYRLADRQQRAEAAESLTAAMIALRRSGEGDPEKADLAAALGILLFNVFPSQSVIRYMAIHRPGGNSRLLQYEHDALMAVNCLLMGKRAAAAGYCWRAGEAAPDSDMKACILVLEGCIALAGGDHNNAAASLEKALAVAGRWQFRAMAGFYLGIVRYEAGETGLALNCFRDAGNSAEGEAEAMAIHNNVGTCQMALGDMGAALRSFEAVESLAAYSGRSQVKRNRAVAAGNAGIIYLSMREYGLAEEQFTKALRMSREIGHARGVTDQLLNLGLAQKGAGDYAGAALRFMAGLKYACATGYVDGVLYARDQLSQALALQGKHDEEDAICRDIARRHPDLIHLLRTRRS